MKHTVERTLVAVLLTGTTVAGSAIPSAAATPHSATVSASTLASEWIAALGPASQQLPEILAKLKALPITATAGQVEAIIAPVAGLVKSIEALAPGAPPPPSPSSGSTGPSTSLETIGPPSHGTCTVFQKASHVPLVMAGQTYTHGFQLITETVQPGGGGNCPGPFEWSWHIGTGFHTFTALVGLDSSDSKSTLLNFGGVRFRADDQTVTEVDLVAGLPTSISINVSSDPTFVIRVPAAPYGGTDGGNTIDVANDKLS